jgi:DNA-binding NarL/FixJ family response regulator
MIMQKSIADSAGEPVQQDRNDIGFNVQELQVYKLMCMRYSSAHISEKLNRAPKTIDSIRNHIWKKTGIKSGNIPELIIWGLKRGILTVK